MTAVTNVTDESKACFIKNTQINVTCLFIALYCIVLLPFREIKTHVEATVPLPALPVSGVSFALFCTVLHYLNNSVSISFAEIIFNDLNREFL